MKFRCRWIKGWRQDFLRIVVFMATIPLVLPVSTLRAAEPFVAIEMAQNANSHAYTTFTNECRNLQESMTTVQVSIDKNEAKRLQFVSMSTEYSERVDGIYRESPKLTEAFRKLAEGFKEIEVVAVSIRQESEEVYSLAMQVRCTADSLPGELRALNFSILVGQLISLGIGFGLGSAIGHIGSATSVATSGGSVNPLTGVVTGATTTITSHSTAVLPLVLPIFGGFGSSGSSCTTGACVRPAPTCVGACQETTKNQQSTDKFCPDCTFQMKDGSLPSPGPTTQTTPTLLTPVPMTEEGGLRL